MYPFVWTVGVLLQCSHRSGVPSRREPAFHTNRTPTQRSNLRTGFSRVQHHHVEPIAGLAVYCRPTTEVLITGAAWAMLSPASVSSRGKRMSAFVSAARITAALLSNGYVF